MIAHGTPEWDLNLTLHDRARRIANRILPVPDCQPHGFYETADFVAMCQMSAANNRLRKAVYSKLFAKTFDEAMLTETQSDPLRRDAA